MATMTTMTREETNKTAARNGSGADVSSRRKLATGSRMIYSRLIGVFFLSAFLLYGVGYGLVTSVTGAADFLSTISAHQITLIIGTFLMLLNSVLVVGLGVLFFPILEKHGKRTALAYMTSRIVEGVFLAVGVVCLLMILPLGQYAVDAGAASAAWNRTLGSLLIQANTTAYQIAMMSLGLASLFMCSLLFRTQLIPRLLSAWGFVGYAIFMTGAIAEIFGIHIGLIFSIPGGLFELAVGIWLIIKGFQPEAYGAGSVEEGAVEDVITPTVLPSASAHAPAASAPSAL